MAEPEGPNERPGGTRAADAVPQLTIAAQYVKDLSFENPNAPHSLAPPKEQPQVEVTVDTEARELAPANHEVSLRIGVVARNAEATLFVIELVYAGVFTMRNIPPESLEAVCLIECPRLLFPFARRIVADATRDGGFPPVLIEPIDFAALYRQQLAQAQTAEAGTPASPGADA